MNDTMILITALGILFMLISLYLLSRSFIGQDEVVCNSSRPHNGNIHEHFLE